MNDQQWDDYIRRQPNTQFGELAAESDRWWKDKSPPLIPPIIRQKRQSPRTSPEPHTAPSGQEQDWSTVAAVLGFVGGGGYMLSRPEPSLIAALVVGVLVAGITGRFYRVLLAIGVLLALGRCWLSA